MRGFTDDFKESVRRATNIVDVISQYTELKRMGGNLKGLCPLPGHNEKTPSFSVNEDMQYYYCFGCHRGGDVFKFAQDVMGKDFVESLEYFAAKAGIPIPEMSQVDGQHKDRQERRRLFEINKTAAQFFENNLQSSNAQRAKEYLKSRGLTDETIEKFQLGYASDSWDQLAKYFETKGVSLKQSDSLGLTKQRKTGDGHYDIFRDRVIYPIHSIQGEVLGFGGRVIDKGEPKYLNSPESPVFHKRTTFYGIDKAAPFIRNEQAVILVEGYMDVIALHQSGVTNAVAALGTAFTRDHAKALAKYAPKVYVLFDGDNAGQSASERALPLMLAEGLLPQGVSMPAGKDPDDWVRELGGEGFKERLKQSKDLYSILLERTIDGRNLTHSDKILVLDKMKSFFVEGIDPTLARLYAQETATRLGLALQAVTPVLLKDLKISVAPVVQQRRSVPSKSGPKNAKKSEVDKLERTLLGLAILEPQFLQKLTEIGFEEHFSSVETIELLKKAQDLSGHKTEGSVNLLALMSTEIQSIGLLELLMAIKAGKYGSDLNRLYEDCSRRLRERILKGKTLALINQLGLESGSDKMDELKRLQDDRLKLMRMSEPEGE
ncbi:MAG: DNA primase [Bdellovibrionales bacterium]|nr:DNA primase [Bdellovibrionales bacterium]